MDGSGGWSDVVKNGRLRSEFQVDGIRRYNHFGSGRPDVKELHGPLHQFLTTK